MNTINTWITKSDDLPKHISFQLCRKVARLQLLKNQNTFTQVPPTDYDSDSIIAHTAKDFAHFAHIHASSGGVL
jgi:hypothetical protein